MPYRILKGCNLIQYWWIDVFIHPDTLHVVTPNLKCQYMLNYFRRSYVLVVTFWGCTVNYRIIMLAEKFLLHVRWEPECPTSTFPILPSVLGWHFHCGTTNEILMSRYTHRMGTLFFEHQIPDFFPNTASFTVESYAAFSWAVWTIPVYYIKIIALLSSFLPRFAFGVTGTWDRKHSRSWGNSRIQHVYRFEIPFLVSAEGIIF